MALITEKTDLDVLAQEVPFAHNFMNNLYYNTKASRQYYFEKSITITRPNNATDYAQFDYINNLTNNTLPYFDMSDLLPLNRNFKLTEIIMTGNIYSGGLVPILNLAFSDTDFGIDVSDNISFNGMSATAIATHKMSFIENSVFTISPYTNFTNRKTNIDKIVTTDSNYKLYVVFLTNIALVAPVASQWIKLTIRGHFIGQDS